MEVLFRKIRKAEELYENIKKNDRKFEGLRRFIIV